MVNFTHVNQIFLKKLTKKLINMIREQQEQIFNDTTEKMKQIMFSKSQDYSVSHDVLNNFKLAGAICGLSPEQNCLSLIATKVARLGNLLASGKTPNNESIEDSILDLANYTLLLEMIIKDK